MEKTNKLIAEFMGHEDYQEMGEYVIPKYHISWDWLMPVVDKIQSISGKLPTHIGNIPNNEDWESNNFLSTNIEETYKAVVKFIKKYNDGKDK